MGTLDREEGTDSANQKWNSWMFFVDMVRRWIGVGCCGHSGMRNLSQNSLPRQLLRCRRGAGYFVRDRIGE
jgi:hypothetical protein